MRSICFALPVQDLILLWGCWVQVFGFSLAPRRSGRRVSHLRRWGGIFAAYPALTRWANLWRAYGATKRESRQQVPLRRASLVDLPPGRRAKSGFVRNDRLGHGGE